jgi:hypothetical protein
MIRTANVAGDPTAYPSFLGSLGFITLPIETPASGTALEQTARPTLLPTFDFSCRAAHRLARSRSLKTRFSEVSLSV